MKQLLKITIGQMIQLNELGYLSSEGKDFLIRFLITEEKEHYFDSQETKLCPEIRTDGKGAKEESESSPNSFHLRQNPDTHNDTIKHKEFIDKDYGN